MKRRSLVVRIWLDDEGSLRGQASDPLTDWRRPFQDAIELWTLMSNFLAEMPTAVAPDFQRPLLEGDPAQLYNGDSVYVGGDDENK